jgi:hypothetical protein
MLELFLYQSKVIHRHLIFISSCSCNGYDMSAVQLPRKHAILAQPIVITFTLWHLRNQQTCMTAYFIIKD